MSNHPFAIHPEEEFDFDEEQNSYNLPTGNELMSRPISSEPPTRQSQEIDYMMNRIQGRLTILKTDEGYETKKLLIFLLALISACIGITLILFALGQTVLFQEYDELNIIALVFGSLFCSPMIYWFYYMYLPPQKEKKLRHSIHKERFERKKPSVFNDMVEEAKKATEPPPKKIRVFAHIRKKDIPIVAGTMEEFCQCLILETGLAVERQLLRYKDEDLEIKLDEKLYGEFYRMEPGSKIYVYNKGGYFTRDSPIKKQFKQKTTVREDDENSLDTGSEYKSNSLSSAIFSQIRASSAGSVGSKTATSNNNNNTNNSRESLKSAFSQRNTSFEHYTEKDYRKDSRRDSMNSTNDRKKSKVSFVERY